VELQIVISHHMVLGDPSLWESIECF
jgi:hypothetical protein